MQEVGGLRGEGVVEDWETASGEVGEEGSWVGRGLCRERALEGWQPAWI